jgi:putative effector of murein hydrolase LrgA (UPF0299 family)
VIGAVFVLVGVLLAAAAITRSYTVAVDGPVVVLLVTFVLVAVGFARWLRRAS